MSAARETSVSDYLSRLANRFIARSENFVAGKYWMLEVLFAAVLFSVLFSAGVDDRLWEVNNNHYYSGYFKKIEHPLFDTGKAYPPQTHEAKLNFRLTVPVLLHILHWPPDQRWILPVLTAAAICAIILLSCVFAFRVTGDRVCSLYFAFGVSCTYIGSFGFTMYYDAIAVAQLAVAMLPRIHWSLRGFMVFTAAFTDERALLAAPILLVQSLCADSPQKPPAQKVFSASFLSVIGGICAYLIGRLLLVQFAGLSSPFEGVGIEAIFYNLPYWHLGWWLALKGGWLLVALAFISLWQRREFLSFGVFAITTALTVCGGFLVEDVLRSTSYVFPALFVALLVVSRNETTHWLRLYCLAAFIISAVAGNYNIWRSQITWFVPIAPKVLYSILEFIFRTTHHAATG